MYLPPPKKIIAWKLGIAIVVAIIVKQKIAIVLIVFQFYLPLMIYMTNI